MKTPTRTFLFIFFSVAILGSGHAQTAPIESMEGIISGLQNSGGGFAAIKAAAFQIFLVASSIRVVWATGEHFLGVLDLRDNLPHTGSHLLLGGGFVYLLDHCEEFSNFIVRSIETVAHQALSPF